MLIDTAISVLILVAIYLAGVLGKAVRQAKVDRRSDEYRTPILAPRR